MAGWLSQFGFSSHSLENARKKPLKERSSPLEKVFFYRDFLRFTGGHLKVWHYFNHVQSSIYYKPYITFSAATIWDETNPWQGMRNQTEECWRPEKADILFLAGMDWAVLNTQQRDEQIKPVINLIQHVRHADSQEPLYQFLKHRAIRICVSQSVTEALLSTKKVNGPVFTITNGVDLSELNQGKIWENRELDLLIVGIKQPALAMEIHSHLKHSSWRIKNLTHALPRPAFLDLLGNAKVALLLPHSTEGFYLPAIEGFALETLVICPDCVGNRSFCISERNCLQPAYHVTAILESVQHAFNLRIPVRQALLKSAWQTAQQHSLLEERRLFLELLAQIESIW